MRTAGSVPDRARNFLPLSAVSDAASSSVRTRGSLPGCKAASV
jgi:hypothetical protein